MKSVLISTRPEWCEKICHEIGTDKDGKPIYEKSIEVRKTKPSIPTPFKCYIYCCKAKSQWRYSNYEGAYENSEGKIVYAQQHVIGEFICDKVMFLTPLGLRGFEMHEEILKMMCLTNDDLNAYGGLKTLYGWHISDLKIYDKPKELSEFRKLKERIEQTCGCLSNNGLCNAVRYEELCDNIKKCCFKEPNAPKSWCYVQELEEMGK